MNAQLWSWILTAVGVCSLYLAGRRSAWGWAVGIGAQVLWFAYAVTTRQWGFLMSCFAYSAVYVINFRRWRAEPAAAHDASPDAPVAVSTMLIATVGLPAAGKSTAALRWVAEDPAGRARVGTYQIADMLRPSMSYEQIEDAGLDLQVDLVEQAAVHGAIAGLLGAGISVVCDDTNLLPRHLQALRELAERCEAAFEVWDLTDVDVETCIARDEQRELDGGRSAGARQIRAKHRLWQSHRPLAAAVAEGV